MTRIIKGAFTTALAEVIACPTNTNANFMGAAYGISRKYHKAAQDCQRVCKRGDRYDAPRLGSILAVPSPKKGLPKEVVWLFSRTQHEKAFIAEYFDAAALQKALLELKEHMELKGYHSVAFPGTLSIYNSANAGEDAIISMTKADIDKVFDPEDPNLVVEIWQE